MTTLTKTHHRNPYPAIDPSTPANSQVGRTVLLTGASTGIGFEIARAFAIASAAQVIILGRSQDQLATAIEKLETWRPNGTSTKFLSRHCDIGSGREIEDLWKGLKNDGIAVDVLILNAAITGPLLISSGSKKVWEYFEVNILANLRMTESFLAQGSEKNKAIVNVSTASVHMNPAKGNSAYATSKAGFTQLLQHLADEVPVDQCQILSCHPGRIFTDAARVAGFTKDSIPWDNIELPAAWCVWAATKAATFLHGRFLWTDWDVDELLDMKDRFNDPGFLKLGLQGVDPVSPEMLFAMT